MGLNRVTLAGIPENRDEDVEVCRRSRSVGRRPCARVGGRGGHGRLPPARRLSRPGPPPAPLLLTPSSPWKRPGISAIRVAPYALLAQLDRASDFDSEG